MRDFSSPFKNSLRGFVEFGSGPKKFAGLYTGISSYKKNPGIVPGLVVSRRFGWDSKRGLVAPFLGLTLLRRLRKSIKNGV
jgi:hypothetical protein